MYSHLSANTVLDYAVDWAVVQTQSWNTLYILSRVRQPPASSIDVRNRRWNNLKPLTFIVGLDFPRCGVWLECFGHLKVRSIWLRSY